MLAALFYKYLRVSAHLSTLIGTGFAVGGGGAIAFISPIIAADTEDIAQTVSVIFLFNVISVVVFPSFAHAVGVSTATGEPFGLFVGVAIHNLSAAAPPASSWDMMWGFGSQALDKTITVQVDPYIDHYSSYGCSFGRSVIIRKNAVPVDYNRFTNEDKLFIEQITHIFAEKLAV